MLIIPATSNVCPVVQGNIFLAMAVLFRIQTRCVANEFENGIHETRNAEKALYYYEQLHKTLKMAKAADNAIKDYRAWAAIRVARCKRDAEWDNKVEQVIQRFGWLIFIIGGVCSACGIILSFLRQQRNESPHPATTRDASPVGRNTQREPQDVPRRRSLRLHRQLRVSRVSQGDSEPTG